MQARKKYGDVPVVKNSEYETSIPSAWRCLLSRIVEAFVRQDYLLGAGVPGVSTVSEVTATHIKESIQHYGATLIPLPEETWDTSVCIWTGEHWDVLIDLRTEEEGSSDLVLQVRVLETGSDYVVHIHMVYVP